MRAMWSIRIILATAGLFVVTGAIDAARAGDHRAGDDQVTLYTPAIRSGVFNCNALNVSQKTLHITISIIDLEGKPLSVSDPIPTDPGQEASNDFGTLTTAIDAYCKFQTVDTDDRNDLRVVLVASLARTFAVGNQTNIPAFVARTVEGY
jgi:hypothetical protein